MQLGFKPDRLRLYLTPGSDFNAQLELRSGTYPVGSTLSLVFGGGSTWTATRDSTTLMTFDVDKVQVDTITDGDSVKLNYTDGTSDQTWALGTVTLNA
jgi:hypothetical protein